jgi:indole-3-glycerol phosphate synthase
MNILDKIIADKRKEVELKKQIIPISQLESSVLFDKTTISLKSNLQKESSGVIAEFKRRSPSRPNLNSTLNVWDAVKTYENNGVSGISILTDGKYFGGSLDDFLVARASVQLPLLRKDFMVDEFQILEAKAHGADVILLIAAVLNSKEIENLSQFAKSLGLEVLLEVHNREELENSLMPSVDLVGVNNRNLKTFETHISTSLELAEFIPNEFVKVSESGIQDGATIKQLRSAGYKGFLIGESFMKSDDFGKNTQELMQEFN